MKNRSLTLSHELMQYKSFNFKLSFTCDFDCLNLKLHLKNKKKSLKLLQIVNIRHLKREKNDLLTNDPALLGV